MKIINQASRLARDQNGSAHRRISAHELALTKMAQKRREARGFTENPFLSTANYKCLKKMYSFNRNRDDRDMWQIVTHELSWFATEIARIALRPRRAFVAAATCFLLMCTTNHHADGKDRTMKLVVLGDSLTAGYGLPPADAFPVKLEQALRKTGQVVVVANAGVSGDTAAMGLARLDRSVPAGTDAVILELGANDMLQRFKPSVTRVSLAAILHKIEARKIAVLLCGVRTQPNLSDEDKHAFAEMFSGLAAEHNALFYPEFDRAFVDQAQLKLADGLHPTAAGIDAAVADILPSVISLIDRTRHRHH